MTKQQRTDFLIVMIVAIVAVLVVFALFLSQRKEPNTFYIALGDSIAAGSGALDNLSQTCGRNEYSYPSIVARELGLTLENIACGGAKLPQGILDVQKPNSESQLGQLLKHPNPGVITLTIGVNDVNWLWIVNECMQRECGTTEDRAAYEAELKEVSKNLRTTFTRIQNRYQNELPDMYVTGYYQLLPAKGSLPIDVTIQEREWMELSRQKLNRAIKEAAREYAFITYVPIDFTGHELYSEESWLRGFDEPALLHPNKAGYEAIAEQVVNAIRHNR